MSRLVTLRAGIPVDVNVLLSDLGIEKQPVNPSLITDAKKVVEYVQAQVGDKTA